MLIVAFTLCLISTLLFYNFFWKRRKLPAGPTPWPLIGNTYTMSRYPPGYGAFQKWSKEFGPVFTYWIGEIPIVAVTDYEVIKETFIKDGDAYAGRYFVDQVIDYLTGFFFRLIPLRCPYVSNSYDDIGVHGVIRTQGEEWQKLRRVSLKLLRDLGMGRNRMESNIINEVNIFVDTLTTSMKEGVEEHDLFSMVNIFAGSTINQLVFGFDFHGEGKAEFHELKEAMEHTGDLFSTAIGQLVMAFPWLRHLPVFSDSFHQLDYGMSRLFKYFNKHVLAKMESQRKLSINSNNNEDMVGEDFVGLFIKEMELAKGTPDEKYYGMESILNLCWDLFTAGQETTSHTLNFLILYLLLDQRVQRKLQVELDEVIGGDRCVTLADKTHLPYTNAVINETQRLCNLLPMNLIHKTTKDVEILGNKIAKDTLIVPQISCVLNDEKIFPNAEKFLPERFLDEEGQLKKCEELIPFSVGKRQCLGESLAKMELFLFIANIFNKFKVLPVDPLKPPTSEKKPGFGVSPYKYKCHLERRH